MTMALSHAYKAVFELGCLYRLLPSTLCLFDVYFKRYIGDKLQTIFRPDYFSEDSYLAFIRCIDLDAKIFLRMSMKHNDR